MDFVLGFIVCIFIFSLLLYAAIRDFQVREVENRVWIIGLLTLPIVILRVLLFGFLLPYILQIGFIFLFVIIGFRIGLWGGADGKALLLISVVYPWVNLNFVWLLVAPLFVILGGFLIEGIHSILILIRNLTAMKSLSNTERETCKPSDRIYWLTRQFSKQKTRAKEPDWIPVAAPMILYFFFTYVILLILTVSPIFLPG
ncbi:MAG: prepilin peptidase [Candidatus Thorarchaeota archaeon]